MYFFSVQNHFNTVTLSVQKSIPIEDIFLKKEKEDEGKRRGLDIEGKGVSYIQKIKKQLSRAELTYIYCKYPL